MKCVKIVAIILLSACLQLAIAEDSRSVESIRMALKSQIPAQIQQRAKQFDDHLIQTRSIEGKPITIVTDSRSAHVSQIVERLLQSIHLNPLEWTVRVLDSNPKIENAFVIGGRYIYIYTGILDNAGSDDEVAFILGHEISHSLLKHQLRREEDTTNLLASIAELGSVLTKNTNRREALNLLGGTIRASYSRDSEREADALGALVANRAGYDPARGRNFFDRMIQQQKNYDAQLPVLIANANQRKQVIEQQLATCENLKAQWNAKPLWRTPNNTQIVNNVCQSAIASGEQFNNWLKQLRMGQFKSIFARTHPLDKDRINALLAEVDYLKGARSLESLSGIGQGYNVLLATNRPLVATQSLHSNKSEAEESVDDKYQSRHSSENEDSGVVYTNGITGLRRDSFIVSDVIVKLPRNEKLKIIGENGEWLNVRTMNDQEGWIRKDWIPR